MDEASPEDEVIERAGALGPLGRRGIPHGPFRRFLRRVIHFFSYHLILGRKTKRVTRAAGFRLTVRPTVFHPRYFISSERFAEFIDRLDLRGKRVVDVGTGSGILALASARAGAENVLAIDVNPIAALTADPHSRRS
jgi:release factor glutamine methyltransferase